MDIASAKLSALAHATEDARKVVAALDQVCSQEKFHPKTVKRAMKGHFGNPITRIDLDVSKRSANAFFQEFWARLLTVDRDAILAELDARLDEEGRLHVRVDKQECFRGLLRIGDQDSIKIEVSFKGWNGSFDEIKLSLSLPN